MWSTMWTWLWGPGINLYDCLSAFFSADELKGDNMYRYEFGKLVHICQHNSSQLWFM